MIAAVLMWRMAGFITLTLPKCTACYRPPVTMAGCPALAVPAGFNAEGLPMGLQIIGPNQADLACLQLAASYDAATNWAARRLPPLLTDSRASH